MAFSNPIDLAAIQQQINEAAQNLAALQDQVNDISGTLDGKVSIYYSATLPEPSTTFLGDMWWDGEKLRRALIDNPTDLAGYELMEDAGLADAIAAASNAQDTADGKIVTFHQNDATPPTAEGVGDLWHVLDKGNLVRRWNGATWVDLTLKDEAVERITGSLIRTAVTGPRWEMSSTDANELKGWTGNPTITTRHTTSITSSYTARDILELAAEGGLITIKGDDGAGAEMALEAFETIDLISQLIRIDNSVGIRFRDFTASLNRGRALQGIDFGFNESVSFNASGFGTVTHAIAATPRAVFVNMNRLFSVNADTFTSTDFRVAIFTAATGVAPAAASRTIDWLAIR